MRVLKYPYYSVLVGGILFQFLKFKKTNVDIFKSLLDDRYLYVEPFNKTHITIESNPITFLVCSINTKFCRSFKSPH